MKDLIIGAASNYDFEKLKIWISSAQRSGFEGDIVIVATNINKETIDQLSKRGVQVYLYGEEQADGSYLKLSKTLSYVDRFLYLHTVLELINISQYRYIISTDTRDVLFQKNPSKWLERNLGNQKLLASSECIKFKDEPFNCINAQEALGPLYYKTIENKEVYNVGVLAGYAKEMKDVIELIWQLSSNSPIRVVDQAVFNMIVHSQLISGIKATRNDSGWAIQLGACEAAVKAGNGECGQKYGASSATIDVYRNLYLDDQPLIDGNCVKSSKGNEYYIVHQYDRIPFLNSAIQNFYNQSDIASIKIQPKNPIVLSAQILAQIQTFECWSEQIIVAQEKALHFETISQGIIALNQILGSSFLSKLLLSTGELVCLISRIFGITELGVKGTNIYNLAKVLQQFQNK
jgi:hypothetical protein